MELYSIFSSFISAPEFQRNEVPLFIVLLIFCTKKVESVSQLFLVSKDLSF